MVNKDNENLFIIPRDFCTNLVRALDKEWIEVNGRGGYSASTILNCHTRKYHGWLVACIPEAGGRFVMVSKMEMSFIKGDSRWDFSINKKGEIFEPKGHSYIESFNYRLHPSVVYRLGDCRVVNSILSLQGENTTVVKYEISGMAKGTKIIVRPLFAYRGIHNVVREREITVEVNESRNGIKFVINDVRGKISDIYINLNLPYKFIKETGWIKDIHYIEEQRRGYESYEDLFYPGVFEITADRKYVNLLFCITTEEKRAQKKVTLSVFDEEANRRLRLKRSLEKKYKEYWPVFYLADKFLVDVITDRGKTRGIVAGYPWFWIWGRDTVISVPGLTFCRNKLKEGIDILKGIAFYEKNGLLPNYIDEKTKKAYYNSADASLWFVWALQQYLKYGGDCRVIKDQFLDTIQNIIEYALKGNEMYTVAYNGLLELHSDRAQCTWMDAVVDGRPVTPRYGFVVELNALWYNALCFWEELCNEWKIESKVGELIQKIRVSFASLFWNKYRKCLYDWVYKDSPNADVRPNQMLAVSLPYSPLPLEIQRAVMEVMKAELVTPFGLRSLSPMDVNYKGVCAGNQAERDRVYHQGTIWPWLIAHYAEGWFKVSDKYEIAPHLETVFSPLINNIVSGYRCLMSLPEIFDGSPPYRPRGAVLQAWSVAELIRFINIMKGD